MEVNEEGVKLLVNLKDYLDTGLFFRSSSSTPIYRNHSKGKRFLNLFC